MAETMSIDFFTKEARSEDDSSSLEDPLLLPNTYVGYETTTLTVDREFVHGTLRKLVQDIQLFAKEVFPIRHFRYHRQTGLLEIASQPKGPYKHKVEGSTILYARVSRSHLIQKAPKDFKFMFELQTLTSTYFLFSQSARERDIWIHEISNNSRINGQAMSTAKVQEQLRKINEEIKTSQIGLDNFDILTQKTRGNSLNSLITSPN
jgi:hypothetical protein